MAMDAWKSRGLRVVAPQPLMPLPV